MKKIFLFILLAMMFSCKPLTRPDYYAQTNYWKKYQNRNDFEAYFRALQIYDFTLFKYIKRLLPQRVDAITGLVVEPNVLERSKFVLNKKPTIEDLKHDSTLDMRETYVISSDYSLFEGSIPLSSSVIMRPTTSQTMPA